MTNTVICRTCGKERQQSELSRTGYKKTLRTVCKVCRNELSRAWCAGRRFSVIDRASKLVSSARSRALAKSLPFDIDTIWAAEIIERGVCQATGIEFDMTTRRGWNTPSLDQIKAGFGYTKTNTRIILFALNTACGDWGEERFLHIAKALIKRKEAQ